MTIAERRERLSLLLDGMRAIRADMRRDERGLHPGERRWMLRACAMIAALRFRPIEVRQ
jgi:hypothetical protein